MSTETMPTTVIWWGAGTAVGGALVIVLTPMAMYVMVPPNTEQWQSAIMTMDVLVQVARAVLPPLGAALIAAGLVMRYIDRRLQGERIADRPRRWRWPDDAREQA
ncbi:hypothetical protein [Agromyces ramosus]|uniref:Uncharacterized protein n=1 Tax=Agromyces ramosus TaxID=33879 RepID=A0ABU0R8J0_9MICO|nr:hypothetical protein [Agromyces ramosus]MDQ0894390.1 hypothetical protein [Agromyces ramosus]